MTRQQKAIAALHDYGTRNGATMANVMKQMQEAGFTLKEIREAAEEMNK